MKPFMSTEELLTLLRKKEEPACTAALEALRLSVELETLQHGIRAFASSAGKLVGLLRVDQPETAKALWELLQDLGQMPETSSRAVEDTFRKMLGPHADLLHKKPDQP